MRRPLLILAMLAAGGAAAIYAFPEWTSAPAEPGYRLGKVDRGPIVATVNATGTINPITTVIVGSQLSGQVVEVLADYNSKVEAGQVVARLNSDQIRARLDAARADLDNMRAVKRVQEAQIGRVRADIERAHASQADMEAQIARHTTQLADVDRNLQRQAELKEKGIAPQAAFDTAKTQRDAQRSALDSARAQLAGAKAQLLGLGADLQVAQAQVQAAEAQIAQREAAVRQIEVDLRNTEIRAPISGVVVQRSIELGQTVAASLQAPILFLIAEDLRRMEIAANIDETDVGRVRPGQHATFTVHAYPARTFEGVVKQVRLGSQTVQNVVIYTTIVAVENPHQELLPGMTANLRIDTERREDVLRIPNAALRWRPPGLAGEVAAPSMASPEAAQGGAPGSGAAARGARLDDFRATLLGELKPSADQQEAIDAAVADLRQAFAAARAGEGDPTLRRERGRAAWTELEQRIAAVLSAEQRVRFDEIRQRFAEARVERAAVRVGRSFVIGADRKPEAVTLRLGASDGALSEVISGLEAGREVIIGGGPRAAEPGGAPRPAPRFGF